MAFWNKWRRKSAEKDKDRIDSKADELKIQEVKADESQIEEIKVQESKKEEPKVLEQTPRESSEVENKLEQSNDAHLLEQIQVIKKLKIEQVPVTYENFLETSIYMQYNVIYNAIHLLRQNNDLLVHNNSYSEKIIELGEEAVAVYSELQKETQQVVLFRQRDQRLRSKIMEYTEIVKRVNDKKLKGEEFEQVKKVLDPKIQEINKERENFLQDEQNINSQLEKLNRSMLKIYTACIELIDNINKNK